jgi:NAD(P)-dependent dehydrogenase (short-subunit alcohol dehydrogenase family)
VIALDVCGPIDTVVVPPACPNDLAETARLVRANGCDVVTGIVDVRDADALHDATDRAVALFGGLDIVGATAGITSRE